MSVDHLLCLGRGVRRTRGRLPSLSDGVTCRPTDRSVTGTYQDLPFPVYDPLCRRPVPPWKDSWTTNSTLDFLLPVVRLVVSGRSPVFTRDTSAGEFRGPPQSSLVYSVRVGVSRWYSYVRVQEGRPTKCQRVSARDSCLSSPRLSVCPLT